jgi:hypothetical protein
LAFDGNKPMREKFLICCNRFREETHLENIPLLRLTEVEGAMLKVPCFGPWLRPPVAPKDPHWEKGNLRLNVLFVSRKRRARGHQLPYKIAPKFCEIKFKTSYWSCNVGPSNLPDVLAPWFQISSWLSG